MTNLDQRVFVAGHRGMVGAALARELDRRGYRNVITRGRQELDLENQNQVHRFFPPRRWTWCTWRPPRSAASWPTRTTRWISCTGT